MLDRNDAELAQVEQDVSYDEADIWISILVPNPELTEDIMEQLLEETGRDQLPDDVPNMMLHDWFYVHVDRSVFDDHGLFYTEDEPFRMGYKEDEYDIEAVDTVNQRLLFQDVIELDGSLDENLRAWLAGACSDIAIDSDAVSERLTEQALSDAESRGDHAVVMATRFEQTLPP